MSLARAALFLAIACGLFMGLYTLSQRVDPVYPDVSRRMKLMAQQAGTIEALTVGNSHNVAIDFLALGVQGFHLWRPAGDLFETRYVVESTVSQLPNLECVFLPASYFLFRRDNAAAVTTNHAERRRELYATTNSFHFLDGDFKHFVQAKFTPVARPDHWKGVVEGLLGKQRDDRLPVREDGLILYYGDTDTLSAAFLDVHAKELAQKDLDLQNEMASHHAALVQDAYNALKGITTYLHKRQADLIIFTPPFYAEYTKQFDRETAEQMERLVHRLSRTHANVQYFDFSTDSTFIQTPAYYRDSDHLNTRGARRFSERLKAAVLAEGGPGARCLAGDR